tara:strand:- start:1294 stop:1479 length:186 start_codon:yes stop_codon:yes gene_type:complete
MASKEIMRFRYRIGKERSLEVIATEKICLKKKEELIAKHNGDVKISKMVPASTHPCGAPHV